jgi:hypothetical protein
MPSNSYEFGKEERSSHFEPAELYRITYGDNAYYFTSSDIDLVLDGNTFLSVPIKRSEIEVTNDIAKSTLKVNMDKNNPVAVIFIRGSLTVPMFITVWYAHLINEAISEYVRRKGYDL